MIHAAAEVAGWQDPDDPGRQVAGFLLERAAQAAASIRSAANHPGLALPDVLHTAGDLMLDVVDRGTVDRPSRPAHHFGPHAPRAARPGATGRHRAGDRLVTTMTRRLPPSSRRTAARPSEPSRLGQPEFTDLGLILVVLILVVASLAWAGAAPAGLLTHQAVPGRRPGARRPAFGSLLDPAAARPVPNQLPGPIAYWSCTLLVVATVNGLVWWRRDLVGDLLDWCNVVRAVGGFVAGMARWRDLRPLASAPRGSRLVPPSCARRPPPLPLRGRRWSATGLGRSAARRSATVEDSVLLVGPPRMGKGVHVVIPWVLDARWARWWRPRPARTAPRHPGRAAPARPGGGVRPAATRRSARRFGVVTGARL